MADPQFFENSGPFTLSALAELSSSILGEATDPLLEIHDVNGLDEADPRHLSYVKDKQYVARLENTQAGACVLSRDLVEHVPKGMNVLLSDDPERAFAKIAQVFYPTRKSSGTNISSHTVVDPTARIAEDVKIDTGAIIGPNVSLGSGTHVCSYAVIGPGVQVGCNAYVGSHVTLGYALIGDRVVIHSGVRIGEDGFGFVMGPQGHEKIPQLGRVIIQDDVEIGANTTIDRGAGPDTVIGEGTKIDNLVQIGHNVHIGRGCIIAGQVGISGSTVLGDFVALGGQVGIADHISIGAGAQVAGTAGVMRDVPSGAVYCGAPARPIREFMREIATLRRIARTKGKRTADE